VTLPRARPAAPPPSRLEVAIDDGRDAVLVSPGAELRPNAKLGLGLVVLASAVLGVLILQRSHASLGSLPSVHSSAAEAELSTQAATAAPPDPLPSAAPAEVIEDELQVAES